MYSFLLVCLRKFQTGSRFRRKKSYVTIIRSVENIFCTKKPLSLKTKAQKETVLFKTVLTSLHFFRTANFSWPGLHVPVLRKAGLPTYRSNASDSLPGFPVVMSLRSRNTVTSSYRILTCFPFHQSNYF